MQVARNDQRYIHSVFFIGDATRAAAATTRAVAAVLIVVLLRVVLGAWEAPPTAGSGQRIAFQLQVLLAYEQGHTERLQPPQTCCASCIFNQTPFA